jgi:hypothetical protein
MLEQDLQSLLLISMQRALLGNIIPAIRAITIGFKGQEELTVIFYFDRFTTQDDKELVSDTIGEVLGDIEFGKVNEFCEYSKEPLSNLLNLNTWVYMRREPSN